MKKGQLILIPEEVLEVREKKLRKRSNCNVPHLLMKRL
jgi:hypothetical protein